jgi:hypothetical protein
MGKASRTKQDPDRRARVAAQRAAARRAEQRRRIYLAGASIVVVILVVVGFVIFKGNGGSSGGSSASGVSNGPTGAALTSVVNQATSVPAATLDQVGSGSGQVSTKPTTISGSLLTSGGKPEMLYVGAEYCPYCAAERWAMVVALSRFGTFSGLATVHSAAKNGAGDAEPYPNTPTWTFVHASYTSKYLTFTPVEQYTNIPDSSNGEYTTLQNLTSQEQSLVNKYDSANQDAIPFVDFGNKYLISGASYNPQTLDGHTWAQVAAALKNPSSQIAQGVDGTANYITAAICKLTNNQPASACTTVVKSLEGQI